MINGTKMYRNMSGEKLSSFSAYSRSKSHRMMPVIIPSSRMSPDSGKYFFMVVFWYRIFTMITNIMHSPKYMTALVVLFISHPKISNFSTITASDVDLIVFRVTNRIQSVTNE